MIISLLPDSTMMPMFPPGHWRLETMESKCVMPRSTKPTALWMSLISSLKSTSVLVWSPLAWLRTHPDRSIRPRRLLRTPNSLMLRSSSMLSITHPTDSLMFMKSDATFWPVLPINSTALISESCGRSLKSLKAWKLIKSGPRQQPFLKSG